MKKKLSEMFLSTDDDRERRRNRLTFHFKMSRGSGRSQNPVSGDAGVVASIFRDEIRDEKRSVHQHLHSCFEWPKVKQGNLFKDAL